MELVEMLRFSPDVNFMPRLNGNLFYNQLVLDLHMHSSDLDYNVAPVLWSKAVDSYLRQ